MKMIIMAGGSGTRLWPLSRTYYPKQFLKLSGMDKSIFQSTIERCLLMGEIKDLFLVTGKDYIHLVQGQIEELGYVLPAENILLEPEAKNTLPAILFAVQKIRETNDDICAVFASDHVIAQPQILADTILKSIPLANKNLVTFGIKPTAPETGFGYIKLGKEVDGGFYVSEFKEKPNAETAEQFIKDGYLWNSGMFMFNSLLFNDAVRKYCPDVYEAFEAKTIEEKFKNTPSISVDYGIIEKLPEVYCVPLNMEWNDLGNFTAFYDKYNSRQDMKGNVFFNDEIMMESKNNMVYSEGDKAIAIIGISDAVVVDQKDALVICHKDYTQNVKDVVSILRERKDLRADYHLTQYHSWGSITILENDEFYKTNKLTVLPGKGLSYQMHYHRSEHFIVVSGTASVVIDGDEKLVRAGESIYVKSGQKYHLVNPSKIKLEVIEVQNGEYLGADDVVVFN